MRTVSFYSLSRVLQDRLTGSISEGFVPVPLARSPGGPKKDTLWLGVMGGAIVLLLALFFVGFGSLGSSLSQHGVVALCLYVALIAVAVLAFIASRRHVTEVKCFPLPRGVYLFPACIVDATSAELRIVPTAEATLSGSGPRVTLTAAGKSYTFEAAAGEDLARLVAEGVQNARVALAENDSAKLAQLDPMHEPRFSSPVGPTRSLRRGAPGLAEARLGRRARGRPRLRSDHLLHAKRDQRRPPLLPGQGRGDRGRVPVVPPPRKDPCS
jgi:hypothetical protein